MPEGGAIITPCASCGAPNRIPAARLRDDPICGRCKARVFPRHPVAASEASFGREVLESPLPVLVDFWAPWCAPCRAMHPVLDELARSRGGVLKVVKVNVDENQGLAARFGVQAIPTLMIWRAGQRVEEVQGAVPRPELERVIARHLA